MRQEIPMSEPAVWTFFYGSYINLDVLREVDLVPGQVEVARLSGFDITIAPRANLVASSQHLVYGILATATHRELHRLYTEHARRVLGGTWEPQAVLAETMSGEWRPALVYIAHAMTPGPAEREYVERIAGPARRFGFPDWYCERIESFATAAGAPSDNR
jgi:hypothetical protein